MPLRQAPHPFVSQAPVDEAGLRKNAGLARDAEHRSRPRASEILYQRTEPRRVRLGGDLERNAAGQADRDRSPWTSLKFPPASRDKFYV